jgi:DNA-directed RNA polymerase subunit A'
MLAKTMDSVGRSTVVVNPELGIDEIEIPTDMAFTMYAPYVQRRLKRMGMKDSDALKHVVDRTPYAKSALEKELEVRPVIYSRAPAWHKFSINAGTVKLTDGDAIGTNPYVAAGMGMDYDGDTINVHVPSSDEAVKEAYDKLMPSKDPFSDRMEGKIVPLPKQEQIMGLYSASISDDQRTYDFDTEEEALRAIKQGKVPTTANINILHGVKRANVW